MPSRARAARTVQRFSKEGYEFDVASNKWQLNKSLHINLDVLASLNLFSNFEKNFRLMLADYASEFSASYLKNIFHLCIDLFVLGVTECVREKHIINFKSNLTPDNEWKLGYIRGFLVDWYDRGGIGVEHKATKLLNSLKLRGTTKGKAVATGCPINGAYTFEEQVAFIDWYVGAYKDGLINIEEYAFIIALQYTGARPIQLCYLYCGDLVTRVEHGIEHFDLNIPTAKKRNERIRESFQHKADLDEDLKLVLYSKSQQSIETIEDYFNIKLDENDRKVVPVFLCEEALYEVKSFSEFVLRTNLNPDYFCMTKGGYSELVSRIARICPLKTSRIIVDGEYGDLHINARRFRYTHATNMAIAGAGAIEIATELGHEDTQYVKVYTEFKEEIADRIDEALAPSLVPLAQAFAGTLIDSEKDAIRANDPRSRINNDKGYAVGNCGNFGFCANGTIHCYTCNKFQAWINAPHKEVLETVVSEREHKRNMGASEFVLQSHNRSIDAIKVVIQKCEERKQELKSNGAYDG
ncbi:hypothetical protein BM527_01040 [Alteromonas sp. Mex14]|nr:hypothetical protein BM527_01040 [Alteromonas sp. Mex14]